MIDNNFGKLGANQIEALAKADPLVDAILKAQDDVDYEAFCANFEGGLRENITKTDFEQNAQHILSSMGKFKEKKFLATLNRQGMIGLVYKCKFDGSPDDFLLTFTLNDQVEPLKASGIWIS